MQVEVVECRPRDKTTLRNLLQFYQYDFSEIEGNGVVDDHGVYNYVDIEPYFSRPDHYPFIVKVDGRPAGCVLVSRHSYLSDSRDTMEISEFFIMRRYRHMGISEKVAEYIFNMFPGKWELQVTARNSAARAFWTRVLNKYTGDFHEMAMDDERLRGHVFWFDNSPVAAPAGSAEG